MVFLSKVSKSALIFLSKESTAARTAMMENIPIVTPSSDNIVRSLLFRKAFIANPKLSLSNLKYRIIYTYLWIGKFQKK